jgi:hypothetical protein
MKLRNLKAASVGIEDVSVLPRFGLVLLAPMAGTKHHLGNASTMSLCGTRNRGLSDQDDGGARVCLACVERCRGLGLHLKTTMGPR